MTENKVIPIKNLTRSCNGCTACCQGWLVGSAYEHQFWPGRPCHYVMESGCSIHDVAPKDPCKDFKCAWLMDENIPEWFYPKKSKVILANKKINNIDYLDVIECGQKLDSEILSWLFLSFLNGKIKNIKYNLNGGPHWIGSTEFVEAMSNKSKSIST